MSFLSSLSCFHRRTGEAISFFYNDQDFLSMDNKRVDKKKVYVTDSNIADLLDELYGIPDVYDIERTEGVVTLGKRTQKQVQLSKRNSENSECFNSLRLGLFENDLLIMLKYRVDDSMLAIGIPQIFYLDYIPDYANKYETNTYLKLPLQQWK